MSEIVQEVSIRVNPEADIQVLMFVAESNKLRDYAESRVILTTEDLRPATNDLSIIAKIKKGMEEKRKEYLKPLEDHKKAVNDAFKMLMFPIEQADKITRDKILAFQAKQESIRREQEEINRLRMEAAKKDAALHNGEISESLNLVEVIPPPPTRTQTEVGGTGIAKIWKFEVTDLNLLPNEYKMADEVKIGKVIRATKGSVSIPGVKVWTEDSLKVYTR